MPLVPCHFGCHHQPGGLGGNGKIYLWEARETRVASDVSKWDQSRGGYLGTVYDELTIVERIVECRLTLIIRIYEMNLS